VQIDGIEDFFKYMEYLINRINLNNVINLIRIKNNGHFIVLFLRQMRKVK